MKKLATRTVQFPLVAEFVIKHNEWVVDAVAGSKKTFGSTVALSTDPAETGLTSGKNSTVTFDAIPMPIGATIVQGEVIVGTAFVGSTAALSVGIAGNTAVYVSALDVAATPSAAFAVTTTVPLASNNGQNIRLSLALGNGDFTAGEVRVRVMYTIDNRASEVVIA